MNIIFQKKSLKKEGKDQKTDFGSDLFNIDYDYKAFFQKNEITDIIFENCLFSNCSHSKLENKKTIKNLMENEKERKYMIDINSFNEIIFKNKYSIFTSIY